MSRGFERGAWEALEGAVEGVILSALFGIIPTLSFVPSYYIGIFKLFEVVFLLGSILVIPRMESWGIGYLAGWLFITWALAGAGLVESWLFTIYAIVGAVALVAKFLQIGEEILRRI